MGSLAAEALRRARALGVAGIAATAVVAVAAAVLVIRFPTALAAFDRRASVNASRSALERTIAGADGLDIDNTFLAEALHLLPPGSPYAVARSASAADAQRLGIVATTFNALPGYLQFLLLPRRQVEPSDAQWLLCYGCDLSRYHDLKIAWRGNPDLAIARLGS